MDDKQQVNYWIFALYCYTHAAVHTRRDKIPILQRATNHLLWSYPGYQVNSGQNRKAQCQVEMAQGRRRGGTKKQNRLLKSGERFKPLWVHMQMPAQLFKCNVCMFLWLKRINLKLNTDIKCITDTNKQLIKYCRNNNKIHFLPSPPNEIEKKQKEGLCTWTCQWDKNCIV